MTLAALLSYLKQGRVPSKFAEVCEEHFSDNNDVVKFFDFLIVRRSSTKYPDCYRYHVTTRCLQKNQKLTVYLSDYYIVLNEDYPAVVKKFPFIIKLHQYGDDELLRRGRLKLQLEHTTEISRTLYGKRSYTDQQTNKLVNAKSKDIFKSEKYNLIGTIIPFLNGKNLHQSYIDGEIKRLSLLEKIELVIKFLKKIAILHNLGQLHGDIKLANIVYDRDTTEIELIDLDSVNTEHNRFFSVASIGFIAPENYGVGRGPANRTLSSDIYSAAGVIGCIFFDPSFAYLCKDKMEVLNTLNPVACWANFIPYNFLHAKNFILKQHVNIQDTLFIIYSYLKGSMCCEDLFQRAKIIDAIDFFERTVIAIATEQSKYTCGSSLKM